MSTKNLTPFSPPTEAGHSLTASPAIHGRADPGPQPLPEAIRGITCQLTSKDYMLLERQLTWSHPAPELPVLALALLRTKLANAQLVMPDDVDPDIATGGSRIVYSFDGRPDETRVLLHSKDHVTPGLGLAVTSLLGLTLLGLRSGQEAPLLRADGSLRQVILRRVAYQPEMQRRPKANEAAGRNRHTATSHAGRIL